MIFLTSCGNQYDSGYDDAWEGKQNPIYALFNSSYREGHKEGKKDFEQFRPLSDSIKQARHELKKTAEEFNKFVDEMGKDLEAKETR